jgi:hypothetical protein
MQNIYSEPEPAETARPSGSRLVVACPAPRTLPLDGYRLVDAGRLGLHLIEYAPPGGRLRHLGLVRPMFWQLLRLVRIAVVTTVNALLSAVYAA